jgi:amino acid transporter
MGRSHWRKMTWVIVIFSALMLLWLIVGIISADNSSHCTHETSRFFSRSDCTAARDVGTGIGVAIISTLWFIGFLVLSVIWLMTRPRGRDCPVCGEKVKRRRITCSSCNYDFAAAAGHVRAQGYQSD